MVLFKSGYRYVRLTTSINSEGASTADKIIRMKRFFGDMDSYRKELGFLNTDLSYVIDSGGCSWTRITEMVVALKRQEEAFRRSGITDFYPISDWLEGNEKALSKRGCGPSALFSKGVQR